MLAQLTKLSLARLGGESHTGEQFRDVANQLTRLLLDCVQRFTLLVREDVLEFVLESL